MALQKAVKHARRLAGRQSGLCQDLSSERTELARLHQYLRDQGAVARRDVLIEFVSDVDLCRTETESCQIRMFAML